MLKVKVKGMPVFYAGARYETDHELIIQNDEANDNLFETLEVIEDNPFKGVKEATLKKLLTDAEIEIPDDANRDMLIELVKEHDLTVG
ncbi:conjugal transfer protein [Enterococcus asini]|uniref:conjugal transfer protein n=1 Tax=Enterococcus asini TaxID=57732 RepID=UPI00241CE470|nr:conjugal transfer protein [Enterococcus asini]